ncbi:triose-phosphate transporter family-domain-containing protein [Podospora australis]|uniref:Triose-phosphate transporter family-domain-containing protein n=1 Tax=Podospora australis TaxID=1536484 RepID=A0AAN7AKX5_9PEZI|nr:triose-phosphate transporter family-domain-containing protein [Podospora australis]
MSLPFSSTDVPQSEPPLPPPPSTATQPRDELLGPSEPNNNNITVSTPPSTSTSGHATPPALAFNTNTDSNTGRKVDAISIPLPITAATVPTTASASVSTSASIPSPSPQSTGSSVAEFEGIEMESMNPAGHRRRRSSLINPVGASNHNRHRSPSTRNGIDGPKISEEESLEEPLRLDELDPGGLTDEDLHDDEETGLTAKDRRRKRRKRNRNQRLDQRIVREKISQEEKKEADRNVLKTLLINVSLIGLWYFFSLLISLYNKWMFSPDKLGFPFPMFTTAVHMLVQFSLASLVLWLIPSFRPYHSQLPSTGHSGEETQTETPTMSKLFYLTRIGPCGVATGLDIGLGNTSLQFITLTFYTMCKSSSLAFVLLFAFILRLETITWRLVAIIGTMTLGVVMMVAGEVEFNLGGFLLVIAAAFFSGFRWGLTQILLLRNPATSNPFSSIFFLAPVMFLTLFSIAIPVEGVHGLLDGYLAMAEERGALIAPLIILFPGCIAFFMTAAEFALLQRTSVVTLSIAGIFKEAVTISAAAIVFGDKMTLVNILGLVVTLCAIAAYNYIKIRRMRQDAQETVHEGHEHVQLDTDSPSSAFSGSGSDRDGDDDDDREDVGLLRRSQDGNDDVLFTADGAEVVSRPAPSAAEIARDEHRD